MKKFLYTLAVALMVSATATADMIDSVSTQQDHRGFVYFRYTSQTAAQYFAEVRLQGTTTFTRVPGTQQGHIGSDRLIFLIDSLVSGGVYETRIVKIATPDTTRTGIFPFTVKYSAVSPNVTAVSATVDGRLSVTFSVYYNMGVGTRYGQYRINDTGPLLNTDTFHFYGPATTVKYVIPVPPNTKVSLRGVGENSITSAASDFMSATTLPAVAPVLASAAIVDTGTKKLTIKHVFDPNGADAKIFVEANVGTGAYYMKGDTIASYGGDKDTTVTLTYTGFEPGKSGNVRITYYNKVGYTVITIPYTMDALPSVPMYLLYTPIQTGGNVIFNADVDPRGNETNVKYIYYDVDDSAHKISTSEVTLPAHFGFTTVEIPVPQSMFVLNHTYVVMLSATNEGGTAPMTLTQEFTITQTTGIENNERVWSGGTALVYNLSGQLLFSDEVTSLSYVPQGLSPGMYVIRFVDAKGPKHTKKIIVQ